MELVDKVAVVTGGASGIGQALVAALAERGSRVVVADVEEDKARAIAEEIDGDVHVVACDVRDREEVERLAEAAWSHFGDVDVVFNNAGVAPSSSGGVIDAEPLDVEWVLSVNVSGVWNGCSVFGRRFARRSRPSWIVNTASEHSLGFVHAGLGVYTASKQAVLGLSEVLRAELPEHVGVSVLCPGLVRSAIWNAARNRPQPLASADEAAVPVAKALIARGMPAMDAARKALDGIERGEFLVVTHPMSRAVAQRRWEEVSAAFDRQAPYEPGCERYDVNAVAEAVRTEAAAKDPR